MSTEDLLEAVVAKSMRRWSGPEGEVRALLADGVAAHLADVQEFLADHHVYLGPDGLVELTSDPVGAIEIAARLGVKRRTVDQWRQRDLGFPVPRWTVGGRPAWDWPDVAAWAEKRATDRATNSADSAL